MANIDYSKLVSFLPQSLVEQPAPDYSKLGDFMPQQKDVPEAPQFDVTTSETQPNTIQSGIAYTEPKYQYNDLFNHLANFVPAPEALKTGDIPQEPGVKETLYPEVMTYAMGGKTFGPLMAAADIAEQPVRDIVEQGQQYAEKNYPNIMQNTLPQLAFEAAKEIPQTALDIGFASSFLPKSLTSVTPKVISTEGRVSMSGEGYSQEIPQDIASLETNPAYMPQNITETNSGFFRPNESGELFPKPLGKSETKGNIKQIITPEDYIPNKSIAKIGDQEVNIIKNPAGMEIDETGHPVPVDPNKTYNYVFDKRGNKYAYPLNVDVNDIKQYFKDSYNVDVFEKLSSTSNLKDGTKFPTQTSIKNAQTEQDRIRMGLEPREKPVPQSFEEAQLRASQIVQEQPDIPIRLVNELKSNARAIDPIEVAILTQHKNNLENDFNTITNRLYKAQEQGNDADILDAQAKMMFLSDQLKDIYKISEETGTKAGRELVARKMLSDESYTPASMTTRMRMANQGQPLTKQQEQIIEKYNKEIPEAKQDYDKYIQRKTGARTKEDIDKAFKDILEEVDQEPPNEPISIDKILEGIDKKIKNGNKENNFSAEIQKIAKELVTNGVRDRDLLIKGIHQIVEPHIPGITEREVAESFSRYGDYKLLKKDEISAKLRDLRGQEQQVLKLEDLLKNGKTLKTGFERRIPSEEEKKLIKLVDWTRKKIEGKTIDPLKGYKTRLQNRIKELNRRLKEGDFESKEKKTKILDQEAMNLEAKYKKLQQNFDREVRKYEKSNRSWGEKARDLWLRTRKEFVLSSPNVFAKLTSAVAMKYVSIAMEEGAGYVLRKIAPELMAKASIEGGPAVKEFARATVEAIKKTAQDANDIIKTGQTNLDVLFGKGYSPEDIPYFGRLHTLFKSPIKRFAFEFSLGRQIEWGLKNGLDITDRDIMDRFKNEAYKYANFQILQSKRKVIDAYKAGLAVLNKGGVTTKTLSTAIQTGLPIVSVPVNFVADVLEYGLGLEAGVGKLLMRKIGRKAAESLTVEEANTIARYLKRGLVGSAALVIGYMHPEFFGGYYQPGKRSPSDVKFGSMKIFGFNIPSILLHNPVIELMQFAATVRRVMDSRQHIRREPVDGSYLTPKKTVSDGLMAAAIGLGEEVPFIEEMFQFSKLQDPNERGQYIGQTLSSIATPQLLNWIAQRIDSQNGEPIKRNPKTLGQYIEMGIPGLRQRVPQKPIKWVNL